SSATSPPGVVVSRVRSSSQSERSSCVGSFPRMTSTQLPLKGLRFAGVTRRNSDWPLPTYSRQHSGNSHSCAQIQSSAKLAHLGPEKTHCSRPVINGRKLANATSSRHEPLIKHQRPH